MNETGSTNQSANAPAGTAEERRLIQARDLERIDAAADRLNEEALDVLEYQASLT